MWANFDQILLAFEQTWARFDRPDASAQPLALRAFCCRRFPGPPASVVGSACAGHFWTLGAKSYARGGSYLGGWGGEACTNSQLTARAAGTGRRSQAKVCRSPSFCPPLGSHSVELAALVVKAVGRRLGRRSRAVGAPLGRRSEHEDGTADVPKFDNIVDHLSLESGCRWHSALRGARHCHPRPPAACWGGGLVSRLGLESILEAGSTLLHRLGKHACHNQRIQRAAVAV